LGRVYDAKIKRIGNSVIEVYESQLTTDFRSNKELLSKVLSTDSKFMVNKIAGYVTSQIKRRAEQTLAEGDQGPDSGAAEGE